MMGNLADEEPPEEKGNDALQPNEDDNFATTILLSAPNEDGHR